MLATIIISALILGLIGRIIYRSFKAHKNGEKTCGCGCSGCSASKTCHPNK